MTTITLTGDQGYEQYRADVADGTIIDADDATFVVDNNVADDGKALATPISIRDAANVTFHGGTVLGNLSQTTDWSTFYKMNPGNSTAIYLRDAPNAHVSGVRIDGAWDGIRASENSDGFLIEDVWITNGRDDAIENDKLNSGTIRDSLFDGNFGGISLDPSSDNPFSGTGKTVTLDGVLMRLKPYLSNGNMVHTSPLKLDTSMPMPELRITNTVIAVEYLDGSPNRLARAWGQLVESSGNVFLNLSDEPLPSKYPMPPKGWTVLQGQEARDYWDNARDKWVAEHAEMALPGDHVPSSVPDDPTPVPDDPTPVPDTGGEATFNGLEFEGDNADNIIIGNALDNYIDGNGGADTIDGGAGDDVLRSDDGADQLRGGAGNDVFLFKRLSDSHGSDGIDTIVDFTRGADKIDLRRLDANRSLDGDQAFVLADGRPAKGEVSAHYDTKTGMTVIDANIDNDVTSELTIYLAGEHHLTADNFIL